MELERYRALLCAIEKGSLSAAGEEMGYTPLNELPDASYNEDNDAAIYPVGMLARDYFNVHKGEFIIFFPQDGHAPAITSVPLKKVVVKVAVE